MLNRVTLSNLYHTCTDRRFRQFNRQRRILNIAERDKAADRIVRYLPRSVSHVHGVSVELAALERDGYACLDPLISKTQIDELLAYLADQKCRDPYRPNLGTFKAPDAVPPETHVSHYTNETILDAPHLL